MSRKFVQLKIYILIWLPWQILTVEDGSRLCGLFMRGRCPNTHGCEYVHADKDSRPPCPNFASCGVCKFGPTCWWYIPPRAHALLMPSPHFGAQKRCKHLLLQSLEPLFQFPSWLVIVCTKVWGESITVPCRGNQHAALREESDEDGSESEPNSSESYVTVAIHLYWFFKVSSRTKNRGRRGAHAYNRTAVPRIARGKTQAMADIDRRLHRGHCCWGIPHVSHKFAKHHLHRMRISSWVAILNVNKLINYWRLVFSFLHLVWIPRLCSSIRSKACPPSRTSLKCRSWRRV